MAFKVRIMTEADIAQVATIEANNFSHPFTSDELMQTLTHPQTNYFVVETYEDIIGAVQAKITAYCGITYLDDTKVEVVTLAVDEQYRREGQAKFLLEMVLRFLQASRVTAVTLEVRPSNTAAIGLYTQFGFEQVAVRKNYYQDPSEDAHLYQKEF